MPSLLIGCNPYHPHVSRAVLPVGSEHRHFSADEESITDTIQSGIGNREYAIMRRPQLVIRVDLARNAGDVAAHFKGEVTVSWRVVDCRYVGEYCRRCFSLHLPS